MKILAVGDIHCKKHVIEKAVKRFDKYDRVVFTGDFADDFNSEPLDSITTWRMINHVQSIYPDKVTVLVGNHDYAYLYQQISGVSSGWNHITQTMLDAPENAEIKYWLIGLPLMVEIDGVTFSHAGVTNEWNGDTSVSGVWTDDSPIWARPRHYGGWSTYKPVPQVFGHSPHQTCTEIEKDIWCVDTFSTRRDGTPIGDGTVLEIIGGQRFSKIKL